MGGEVRTGELIEAQSPCLVGEDVAGDVEGGQGRVRGIALEDSRLAGSLRGRGEAVVAGRTVHHVTLQTVSHHDLSECHDVVVNLVVCALAVVCCGSINLHFLRHTGVERQADGAPSVRLAVHRLVAGLMNGEYVGFEFLIPYALCGST